MSSFVRRYDDETPPDSVASAAKDLVVRCIAPAVPWFGVLLALGWVIMSLFHGARGEDQINRDIQSGRTQVWDTVTRYWSELGSTWPNIVTALLSVLVVFLVTRKWWVAVLPGIAISVQATVFVLVTWITGRPRPDVPHLDDAPPTSSYPSGHMGATTALYVTFALLAQRIHNDALRRGLTVVFLIVPLLVGYARLYRGMHHLSDVLIGALNGIVSAGLAWRYLRRDGDRRTLDHRN